MGIETTPHVTVIDIDNYCSHCGDSPAWPVNITDENGEIVSQYNLCAACDDAETKALEEGN